MGFPSPSRPLGKNKLYHVFAVVPIVRRHSRGCRISGTSSGPRGTTIKGLNPRDGIGYPWWTPEAVRYVNDDRGDGPAGAEGRIVEGEARGA